MESVSLRTKYLLITLALFVYIAGLHVTIMDIDAAQYASMSRQISASRHFFLSLLQPPDYLDKPPLLFFLAALSFKLFGVSTVSYKLPSLLMTLLGFYATYRLGKLLYNKRIGVLAATLLCSCQAFIYFTNDVRTDANLAGAVIFAIWQIAEFLATKKVKYFFGGFFGIALAMLAKGPIGLMVPVLAIGSYFAGRRDFRLFVKWYWFAGLIIIFVALLPMLWGLHQQFGWRGIRFYFWTQSFGRITGESSWKDTSGYFYFVHTFLWAFLPWMLLAYYSIGDHVVRVIKKRFDPAYAKEMLLLGGIVFPFVALSCSRYKLPHYIFVFFPLVAILTAKTICEIVETPARKKAFGIFFYTQATCCVLMWIFALICMTVFFPCKNVMIWLLVAATACGTFYFLLRRRHAMLTRMVLPSLFAILGLNLMINIHFFPRLLSFQGGSTAAARVRAHQIPVDRLYAYRAHNHSIDFYTQSMVPVLDSIQLKEALKNQDVWIYAEPAGLRSIQQMGFTPAIVDSFPNVHVARITAKFLFYKTRPALLGKQYILHNIPPDTTFMNYN